MVARATKLRWRSAEAWRLLRVSQVAYACRPFRTRLAPQLAGVCSWPEGALGQPICLCMLSSFRQICHMPDLSSATESKLAMAHQASHARNLSAAHLLSLTTSDWFHLYVVAASSPSLQLGCCSDVKQWVWLLTGQASSASRIGQF